MPPETNVNNPALLIDEKVRAKRFGELQGHSDSRLETDLTKKEADMIKAVEQAGDDMDISKVDCLGGKTTAEKAEALVTLHSDIAAHTDQITRRKQMKAMAENIRKGNRPGAAFAGDELDPDALKDASPPQGRIILPEGKPFSKYVRDAIAADGIDLSNMGSMAAGIDLDMINDPGILNTLFQTTDGWAPFVQRMPGFVPDAQRPVQVTDVIPAVMTTQSAIKYMEETVFVNNAAGVAEGAALPEAELQLVERDQPIRKRGVHIPVTEEQLEDEPQVDRYLNHRLPFMVRQELDGQIINGDNAGENLNGILNRGNTLTQEVDYDLSEGAHVKPLHGLKRAKTKVRFEGRAIPGTYILNPNFWDDVALQESTAGGFYLGNPQNMFMPRVWGLPVVESDILADGNADNEVMGIVGDFANFSYLAVRRDMRIEMGLINDDWTKGLTRIKATIRVALVVDRAQAFVKLQANAVA